MKIDFFCETATDLSNKPEEYEDYLEMLEQKTGETKTPSIQYNYHIPFGGDTNYNTKWQGSAPWMAPEVTSNNYGFKADVYSFGLVMLNTFPKFLTEAQAMVGSYYGHFLHACGVEQSDTEAFRYSKLAADQGLCLAQFNLANMYTKGQGVIQSDELAFTYYKLSADQGFANAQCNVGNGYCNGEGVDQSFTKARECWNKAAKQGYEHAIENLKMLDEREGIKTKCQTHTIKSQLSFKPLTSIPMANSTKRNCCKL